MAAQDIQIHRGAVLPRSNAASYQSDDASYSSGEPEQSLAATVLLAALRRRWWLFLIITLISGGAAFVVAKQFSKDHAKLETTLIYTGLPGPFGPDVYKPLPTGTCAELVTSVELLSKLQEKRALDVPPAILRRQVTANANQYSSLLAITLEWHELEDGIAALNELSNLFVDEIVARRRATLSEHLQHVELAQLQARNEVAEARQEIEGLRDQYQRRLDEGGLNNERYRSLLTSVGNTKLAIDEKLVAQAGIEQQIQVIDAQIAELSAKNSEQLGTLKRDLARSVAGILKERSSTYAAGSAGLQELNGLIEEISSFYKSSDSPAELREWCTALAALGTSATDRLTADDIERINNLHEELLTTNTAKFDQQQASADALYKSRQSLELSLIPLKNQVAMFEKRAEVYQKEADEIGGQISGIGNSAFDALELRLEAAQDKQNMLSRQLDAMQQLERCRIREWAVSSPASAQTAEVSSNAKKLFVLTFGLCGLILSSPVLLSEWNRQRSAPEVRFVRSLRLPVLSERMLKDFSPETRLAGFSELTDDQRESLRNLTLKIQQSSHKTGTVILFSCIDRSGSAAPILAAVAKCLAAREERVLVVDAVCPERTIASLAGLMTPPLSQRGLAKKPGAAVIVPEKPLPLAASPGLAEFLSEECEAVSDLIHPSGYPGIDVISSGGQRFPQEAMASSCLTELVDTCRRNYTMILVNGPATTSSADLQMLAARADGVVLTASKSVHRNSQARAAVTDLIELGAPIIGVIA